MPLAALFLRNGYPPPMLRPSRPITVWLLWLAIVLLPVRAWAASTMVLDDGAVAVVQMAGAMQHDAAVPCHGGHHTDASASPQTCSLCDVCHSACAGLPAAQLALPPLPPAVPCAAAVQPVEPAVRAGPERPPRIVLA